MEKFLIDMLIVGAMQFLDGEYYAHSLDCNFGYDPGFSMDQLEKIQACEDFLDLVFTEQSHALN